MIKYYCDVCETLIDEQAASMNANVDNQGKSFHFCVTHKDEMVKHVDTLKASQTTTTTTTA